jgi:hypothetical protein
MEVAPNREARAAPRITGGELLPNARAREGQRNLSASGHCTFFFFHLLNFFFLQDASCKSRLLGGDSQ